MPRRLLDEPQQAKARRKGAAGRMAAGYGADTEKADYLPTLPLQIYLRFLFCIDQNLQQGKLWRG